MELDAMPLVIREHYWWLKIAAAPGSVDTSGVVKGAFLNFDFTSYVSSVTSFKIHSVCGLPVGLTADESIVTQPRITS